MTRKLGVARWVCGVSLGWLSGTLGCGDSGSASEPIVPADAGPSLGGSGGDDSARDAGSTGIEFPFPDLEIPMQPASCEPGETLSCTLDFLCSGTQTCNTEGSTFGPCDCGGSVIASGNAVVGAACEDNTDCLGGATCMRADSDDYLGQGGPGRGYCTFGCNVTADCTAFDPLSLCGPVGPAGARRCVRTCQSKDPAPGEDKCLNRPELVCTSMAANGEAGFSAERQEGVCLPRCGSNADCPSGRVCRFQGGICDTAQIPGAPIGSSCSLDQDCNGGECVDRNDENVGTCTAFCTLGSLSGCGFARDAELRGAACVAPLISSSGFSEGAGDVGVCQQLCDVDADCLRADEGGTCIRLGPATQAFFGRSGACISPPD